MVLGIGDAPIYFLLAVSAVWPIVLNTAEGVRRVDRRWIEMARSLGATEAETVRFVVVPAIVAHVVTGLRLGLGVAWIVLVPAEMLGVRAGLGYAILDARDRLAYPELMAIVLLIGCLGWAMDALTRRIQSLGRRSCRITPCRDGCKLVIILWFVQLDSAQSQGQAGGGTTHLGDGNRDRTQSGGDQAGDEGVVVAEDGKVAGHGKPSSWAVEVPSAPSSRRGRRRR